MRLQKKEWTFTFCNISFNLLLVLLPPPQPVTQQCWKRTPVIGSLTYTLRGPVMSSYARVQPRPETKKNYCGTTGREQKEPEIINNKTRATIVAVLSTVVFAWRMNLKCSIFIGAMSFRQLLLFIYSIHVYFTSCGENNNTKSSQLRANSAFDRNRKQHLVASEIKKKREKLI